MVIISPFKHHTVGARCKTFAAVPLPRRPTSEKRVLNLPRKALPNHYVSAERNEPTFYKFTITSCVNSNAVNWKG